MLVPVLYARGHCTHLCGVDVDRSGYSPPWRLASAPEGLKTSSVCLVRELYHVILPLDKYAARCTYTLRVDEYNGTSTYVTTGVHIPVCILR